MHNGVIAHRKLPLRYVAFDLPPEALPDFFRVIRSGNFLGGNVTIPYKDRITSYNVCYTKLLRLSLEKGLNPDQLRKWILFEGAADPKISYNFV